MVLLRAVKVASLTLWFMLTPLVAMAQTQQEPAPPSQSTPAPSAAQPPAAPQTQPTPAASPQVQTAAPAEKLKPEQLEALVAPIALYPDNLLSPVLWHHWAHLKDRTKRTTSYFLFLFHAPDIWIQVRRST